MRSEKTTSWLTMVGSMEGPEHWNNKKKLNCFVVIKWTLQKMRRDKSDTNHYNFANVLKGTVRNAAILDRVTHKSQGLPQHTAKHLHLQRK